MVWTMRIRTILAVMLVALGAWLPARALAEITRYEVEVAGLACPFCVRGLEERLGRLPGAQAIQVDLEGGVARFAVAEGVLSPEAVQRAVKSAGFSPRGLRVEARGALRGSGDEMSLEVGGGLVLPVRGGGAIEALRQLERAGERDVVLVGKLTETSGRWQLAVDEARAGAVGRG